MRSLLRITIFECDTLSALGPENGICAFSSYDEELATCVILNFIMSHCTDLIKISDWHQRNEILICRTTTICKE